MADDQDTPVFRRRDEALVNVREAIEAYLEDCRESGEPIPSENGGEIVEVDAA